MTFERLHRQPFLAFDDETGLEGYTVVACRRCGFVYADDLPEQRIFDEYYRDLSKYEAEDIDGVIPPWKARIHQDIVADISQRLPDRNLRILDVGAASGHLLATFARSGYHNAIGFDPSPRCSEIAAQLYDVRVDSTSIAQMQFGGQRFDLILMASVLEHVRDLGSALRDLRRLLTPTGALWVEVPDAGRFASYLSSPFQQFSTEHINFFSRVTLARLMGAHGLTTQTCWETIRMIHAMPDPGLDGLFSIGPPTVYDAFDATGVAEIREYVAASERLEREMVARTSALVEAGTPVIVWGTGSLTLQLLARGGMENLRITGFVDANRNYHGKSLRGKPVIAPAEMHGFSDDIVVVSHASEPAIIDDITTKYGLPNAVLGLTSGVSRPRN
jgi:SAM-dependent methyltransferase